MAAKSPLTLAFNLPFVEAIKAAELRGVQLPSVYYGQLQGLARQQAFSIAGIASLDQLQAVKNSLDEFMRSGGSFTAWKKKAAVLDLNLPAHRLDNIWRTNLQGNYLRGHWEQFVRNAESRPYLMYDAINDSRVRPSHLAHDGTIRPVLDAFWSTHSPPLGYRCRCNLISLTEEQAMARSRPNPDGQGTGIYKTPQLEGGIPAEPDKGWDYNPFEDRLAPLRKALERFDPKLRAVGEDRISSMQTYGLATIARATPNQPTWKSIGKLDLRAVHEVLIEASPKLINGANSLDEAVQSLRVAIGMGDKQIITVTTPIESVSITAESLPHVVEKRSDQRERFGLFVMPTLLRPTEVWKVQYDDGSFRNRYLKLFSGSRYDILVMVKVAQDGSVFWNMMHRDRKGMNSLRIGDLVFDGL